MNTADPGYCTNCGARLVAGDRFCMSCGAVIEPDPAPQSPNAPAGPIEASDFDPDMTVIRPRTKAPVASGPASGSADNVEGDGELAPHADNAEGADNEPPDYLVDAATDSPETGERAAYATPDSARDHYPAEGYPPVGLPAGGYAPSGRRASAWNYLWLFLGVAGGLAGFFIIKDRDPKRAKGVLIGGGVVSGVAILLSVVYYILLAAVFAKGVSSMSTYSPTPRSTYYGSTPTPTPTGGTDVDSFTVVRSWQWAYTQTGGYSESVDFTVGDPIAVSSAPYLTYSSGATMSAGEECAVNTARDAVVPFRLTTTNKTQGFEVTTSSAASANTSVETYYNNSGATCKSSGSDFGGHSTSPAATNESSSTRGFIILSDYYSPNLPNGDPSVLNAVKISVGSSTIDSSTWSLTAAGVSGPGSTNGGYGTVDAFYLSGVVPRN